MTVYASRKVWLWIVGACIAVAGVAVVVFVRWRASVQQAKAALDVAHAKVDLERVQDAATKAATLAAETAAQQAAAETQLNEKIAKLAQTLKDTGGMTDEEVDRDLARRGLR